MKLIALRDLSGKNQTIREGQVISLPIELAEGLIDARIIKPLKKVFKELYHEHMERLSRHDLLPSEIEPSRLAEIHRGIEEMDSAFHAEDLQKFKSAMSKVEFLYHQALKEVTKDDRETFYCNRSSKDAANLT